VNPLPSGAPILQDEILAKHTSYRIGGPARYMAFPRDAGDLAFLATEIRKNKLPYVVLGNGSNVLAPDAGFPGMVISTKELESTRLEFEGTEVVAGAGVLNSRLLRAAADKALGGIAFLSGVPGNVGGAVYMNAGTGSGWIQDRLEEVTSYSFSKGIAVHKKETLRYAYREQFFLNPDAIILSAKLNLIPGASSDIKAELAEATKKRKAAQPIELPSCGSVFRNPPGKNAWQLIAEAGLRGRKQGGARFSEKHCNFIVNEGGATAADVEFLVSLAKKEVKEKCGIELQQELVLLQAKVLP
jgi:UDP-N-acetylmuramate dehydrogenase